MNIKNASRQLWMQRWEWQKIWEGCAKTTQPTPAPPIRTQMMVPRGIWIYPSFPNRRCLTDMSATTTTTKNGVKLHKVHSLKYTLPTTAPPVGRQIMVLRGIMTYQSLPDRQFTTTMLTTKMTKNKRWKSHEGHSAHAWSSLREADDSFQRYYDWPKHYPKVIPNNFDQNNDDDE